MPVVKEGKYGTAVASTKPRTGRAAQLARQAIADREAQMKQIQANRAAGIEMGQAAPTKTATKKRQRKSRAERNLRGMAV